VSLDEAAEREAGAGGVATVEVPLRGGEELGRLALIEAGGEAVVEAGELGLKRELILILAEDHTGIDEAACVVAGALELADGGVDAAREGELAVLAAREVGEEDVVGLGGHAEVTLVVVVIGEVQECLLCEGRAWEALVDADDDFFGGGDTIVDAEEQPALAAEAAEVEAGDFELFLEGWDELLRAWEVLDDFFVVVEGVELSVLEEFRVASEEDGLGVVGVLLGGTLDPLFDAIFGVGSSALGEELSDGVHLGAVW
jgi:hypothetical protein